jgi:cation diffusion facilitator family transporter
MKSRKAGAFTVLVALGANVAIAITKFIAASISGSSAMASEGVHSVVDAIEDALLYYGLRRAHKPPDDSRPLGYGRELYFWSFIVTIMVFTLGTGAAWVEGTLHLLHAEPLRDARVNYIVLAISLALEGTSWVIALRTFRRAKGERGYFEAFRRSKDPSVFAVLFEDTAAIVGLVIAFAGIAGAQALDMPALDGIASYGIGLVLAVSSFLLAREIKALLIGEPADTRIRDSILGIAADDDGVRRANGVITSQLGPQQVVAALSAEFEDDLATTDIEQAVERIETAIKQENPDIAALFIKPQTAQTWEEGARQLRRRGARRE